MTKRKTQKVLVTGGGGFLGSAIVKLLVERGDRVRSFSRSFYQKPASIGVKQIRGDISNKIAVERACRSMDTVFHVAAKSGVCGSYSDYYKTNVIGTQNVISACKKHKVSRLVYTSSPSVVFNGTDMEGMNESLPYPDSFCTHYPKTKAMAEKYVVKAAKDGLMTITLRPHLIWGPGDNHLIPRIIEKAKMLIRIGNGKNLVDTIYVNNAAHAHILAADALKKNHKLSGNIYFISQDKPVLLWDMINNILKAAGLPCVKYSMPRKMAWLIGAAAEFLYTIFNITGEPPMTRFVADELATAHWFDISAAKRDIGYIPKVSTKEGLCRLKNWLQS